MTKSFVSWYVIWVQFLRIKKNLKNRPIKHSEDADTSIFQKSVVNFKNKFVSP